MGAPRVLFAWTVEVGSAMPKGRTHRSPRNLQRLLLCGIAMFSEDCEETMMIIMGIGVAKSTLHHI